MMMMIIIITTITCYENSKLSTTTLQRNRPSKANSLTIARS